MFTSIALNWDLLPSTQILKNSLLNLVLSTFAPDEPTLKVGSADFN